MLRPLDTYLLAALSLLACKPPADDGADATIGSSVGDPIGSTSSATPTTGDDHGETTAPPTTATNDDGSYATEVLPDCSAFEVSVVARRPRVMLVLDKSGSMVADPAGHWDHDGNPDTPELTRWHSLYTTVETLVTPFASRIDFGAVLFPSLMATDEYSAQACPVSALPDVPVSPDQAAEILLTIPPADALTLHGGTPTTAGIRTALAGLASDDPAVVGVPQAIVLVTDGAANCSTDPIDDQDSSLFEVHDEQLIPVVADALAAGIPTHVVGIDIADLLSGTEVDGEPDLTNTFARLNELAEAGGRPRPGLVKFHDATDQPALELALQEVFTLSTSCVLDFAQQLPPVQFIREVVVGGPDPLVYGSFEVDDCADQSGWHFTDDTRTAMELCGTACSQFQSSGELAIDFDCEVA